MQRKILIQILESYGLYKIIFFDHHRKIEQQLYTMLINAFNFMYGFEISKAKYTDTFKM